MEFGLFFLNEKPPGATDEKVYREVLEQCRVADELGYDAVWLAEHTGLDVLCAIKLIDPRGKESAELRARFEREAKAAAQLKSRHVVQILDHGVWQDIPYIAMEYLQGEDLAQRIARMVRLPLSETLRIVSQVCRALTRAHAGGIVHRDLKPENIFLAREDDTEVAKVLAAVLGARLIRLQCYEGLDINTAVYEWNYPRQMLEIRLMEARGEAKATTARDIFGPEFLIKRPLLQALEATDGTPPVLLIDELDRADEEFEAYLLEILSDFQVTIPEIGTVRAERPPRVVLTSNRTREIHDALKRRCVYCWIDYPDAATERRILAAKVPDVPARLAQTGDRWKDALTRKQSLERALGREAPVGQAESGKAWAGKAGTGKRKAGDAKAGGT